MSLNACGKHDFRVNGVCEGCVRDDERQKYDAELTGRIVIAVERIASAIERASIAVDRAHSVQSQNFTVWSGSNSCTHRFESIPGGNRCVLCGLTETAMR